VKRSLQPANQADDTNWGSFIRVIGVICGYFFVVSKVFS